MVTKETPFTVIEWEGSEVNGKKEPMSAVAECAPGAAREGATSVEMEYTEVSNAPTQECQLQMLPPVIDMPPTEKPRRRSTIVRSWRLTHRPEFEQTVLHQLRAPAFLSGVASNRPPPPPFLCCIGMRASLFSAKPTGAAYRQKPLPQHPASTAPPRQRPTYEDQEGGVVTF